MVTGRNRLASELSPYLLQHANNPVDWHPWGPEALEKARRDDKPILLSIGYSACHWCHVMERECFENEAIAAQMNASFINIKVDREERPDLDAIYMNAVQMMTGAGGWPLTAFLDPDGVPFFAGTYFPSEDRYGRPGFPRVLDALARAWRDKRDEIERTGKQVQAGFTKLRTLSPAPEALSLATVDKAGEAILAMHDTENGGFGEQPKFPNVPAFSRLLRHHHVTERADFLNAFELTLDRMAQGGVYDQLAGGFHRYSVDAHWLVPHFEKMLYDNVQLAPLYADGFQMSESPLYRQIVYDTLGYLIREMRHTEGGFFSTQDADTNGEEGLTYLWRTEEIRALLGEGTGDIVCRHYGVDEAGNFAEPGASVRRSILHQAMVPGDLARFFARPEEEIRSVLKSSRETLLAERTRRPQPARDEKILTAWNALAIRALVHCANVFQEEDWLEVASGTASFIQQNLVRDGRLQRVWKDGTARYDAYLDDYAYLAAAQLDLWKARGRVEDLETARNLAEHILSSFEDANDGGFFFTSHDHEKLVDRSKIFLDGSLPSGNAVAADTLLRLGRLIGEERYTKAGLRTLELYSRAMTQQPFAMSSMIATLEDHLRHPTELVISGPHDDPRTITLCEAAYASYSPGIDVLRAAIPNEEIEVLRGRVESEGKPTAYLCRGPVCSPPIYEGHVLREALRQVEQEGKRPPGTP